MKAERLAAGVSQGAIAKALGFKIHVNTAAVLPHQKNFWMEEVHHDIWKD